MVVYRLAEYAVAPLLVLSDPPVVGRRVHQLVELAAASTGQRALLEVVALCMNFSIVLKHLDKSDMMKICRLHSMRCLYTADHKPAAIDNNLALTTTNYHHRVPANGYYFSA
jgi:hypothetical protein